MIVEIPDFAAFEQFMQTEEAAEAMKHDGVRPETLDGPTRAAGIGVARGLPGMLAAIGELSR
jgi:hypothetical protein